MQTSQYTNIAFISYKREDEEWAKWLQKKLEHYKLPTEIRKQNPDMEFAKNPRHVFKDTTDLSGGVLAKAIKEGLDSSKFLIVICSPRAAKSEWVCKEVQDFIDSGREEYIIPFIIDGEPYAKNQENECFPEALKTLAGERELLGININENGRESASVKVVSRVFDLRFDTLWNRFQREQKKRRQTIITVLVASILLIAGIASWIGWQYMELGKANDTIEHQYTELQAKNSQIKQQNKDLDAKSDSIQAANDSIQRAYEKLNLSEKQLALSNAHLIKTNKMLELERNNVLNANHRILSQRSKEYGDLAYKYIEEGKIKDAENLIDQIIPNGNDMYVYTPQMEKSLRRYYNYLEEPRIKLIENREILGQGYSVRSPYMNNYGNNISDIEIDYTETPMGEDVTLFVNHQKDTLLRIFEDYDTEFLSKDGSVFIGEKSDTISIWNIATKTLLCKEYLEDGLLNLKFLKNNRICLVGYENFYIYDYNRGKLRLESVTKILGEPFKLGRSIKTDFPFCFDENRLVFIYQTGDSCLITQGVNSTESIESRKIDGVISKMSLGSYMKEIPRNLLAFTYTNKASLDLQRINENKLRIFLYPNFTHLYERPLFAYSCYELAFLNDKYLYARTNTDKSSTFHEYVWDVTKPFRLEPDHLFSKNKVFSLLRSTAEEMNREVLFMSDDGGMAFVYGNMDTPYYSLCLQDSFGIVDTLVSADRSSELKFQSSLNGHYMVYSALGEGVYLFNRLKNTKTKLSKETHADVTISLDGGVIAYTYYDEKEKIAIYNVKTGKALTYTPHIDFVTYLQLNNNGTKLMFTDSNYTLYDLNLSTNECKTISSLGEFSKCFGYSRSGKYLYQVYHEGGYTSENRINNYIMVWDANTMELIMKNMIGFSDLIIFDDVSSDSHIYSHCRYRTEHIPFYSLDNLFEKWKKQKNIRK